MRFAFILLIVSGFASEARGQGGVYVGGVVFADMLRASGQTASSIPVWATGLTKLDGTAIGGGIRGGAFLAPRWSLEIGVDVGAAINNTVSPLIVPQVSARVGPAPVVVAPSFFPPQVEQRATTKTTATSVLLAYHPPARKRLRPGFAGGLSFMHTTATLVSTVRYAAGGPGFFLVPLPPPTITRIETTSNQIAATVGAELAFELSRRAAIVPEIRAHGFDGQFVVRPGVGIRWHW